jgi:hypothetical protein
MGAIKIGNVEKGKLLFQIFVVFNATGSYRLDISINV